MANDEKTVPLAGELDFIGGGLQNLQHLDTVADHLSDIALYLRRMSETATLSAIAQHGNQEDKQQAVKFLKEKSDCMF